ncbi:SagB family peptide dehydrogenase [Rhodopirellula bahusiensis]|uniref:SagB family peptide dehydrogenase n=1 Tax=Rhodopirellula bahusiensis TaxID=2014065 RepID=UPI003264C71D
MPDKVVRRSSTLVAYWENEALTVENYFAGRRVTVHPSLAQVLASFSSPQTIGDIEASLSDIPNVETLIADLLDYQLLLEVGSEADLFERELQAWNWGRDAEFFHFSTKSVEYTFDFDHIREHFEAKARESPPPSPFKIAEGDSVALYPAKPLSKGVGEVLKDRRTCRDFDRREISLQQLSDLLHWTWGKQRHLDSSVLDQRILKTSPSGGARHPIEVYVFVQRVAGIPAGLYHYSVRNHELIDLKNPISESHLVELFSGQYWVADASAAFIMTAMLPRVMWKYDHSRAYRVIQLDAGHLGQTFHLVATALGLGPFTTAALQDEKIETALGIDGVEEIVVYAGAAGVPSIASLGETI